MTYEHENAPGGRPGALSTAGKHRQDSPHGCLTGSGANHLATAFLHACLTSLPAQQAQALASDLTAHDFPQPQQWTVWQAIARRARQQAGTDDAHLPVAPETVLTDLQTAGEFTPVVQSLLLDALGQVRNGVRLPGADVLELVEALRRLRFRRACATAGTALVSAAEEGSDTDLQTAVTHAVKHLPGIARRAGLEVSTR